jgi:uncharacterized protein YndB with AHSA1/START domain
MASWEFSVQHSIMAKPRRVFQVWTDGNDSRGPWVGDGDRHLDAWEGGEFSWDDRNFSDLGGGGGCWGHWGKFTKLNSAELPYNIEYTWRSQWTDQYETMVLVSMEPDKSDERFTVVTLSMTGLPNNRHGWEHKNAWIRILGDMGAKFWGNAEEEDKRPKVLH